MKFIRHILIFMLISISVFSSCQNEENPSLSELAFEKLSGTWGFGTEGSIRLDGEDISLNYPGFTLSFAEGTYQTTNGADLFRASGTWEWIGDEGNILALDTGEEVTVNALNINELDFSFVHVGSTRAGIQGNYRVQVFK